MMRLSNYCRRNLSVSSIVYAYIPFNLPQISSLIFARMQNRDLGFYDIYQEIIGMGYRIKPVEISFFGRSERPFSEKHIHEDYKFSEYVHR